MALTKIKQANRKWKHELARRKKRQQRLLQGLDMKARNKLTRQEAIARRKEQLARREKELEYVEQLKQGLLQ